MQGLQHNNAVLVLALQGLSGLRTLGLGAFHAAERLDWVWQLTKLRELRIKAPDNSRGLLLLQLTHLQQLTALTYFGAFGASNETVLVCEVSYALIGYLHCLSAVMCCFPTVAECLAG
jgi:hypothetical protein